MESPFNPDRFHPLRADGELPARLNNPLLLPGQQHPLLLLAADEVRSYVDSHPEWADELGWGKMLGGLVCREEAGRTGFLAAYSGQLGGREDWPWFVPAVFDYLQPDGYFKREEAEITAINRRIGVLEQSETLAEGRRQLAQLRRQAEAETDAYRRLTDEARARRRELRAAGADDEALVRESQFQKAELRRLKQRWRDVLARAGEELQPQEEAIARLKEERHRRSDALQRWLFDQFVMVNSRGERRTLTDIFALTPQRVPPAGAGECCAPKLLQYAFLNHLQPLLIAEFWQGRSPRMEVRHHGLFYPACRGKCKPILEWMLGSEKMEAKSDGFASAPVSSSCAVANSSLFTLHSSLPTLHSSLPDFLVVDKPAGLLSVPGRTGEESVESLLRRQYGQVWMVHRLDQDTSGLMVVALTEEAYHNLQQQFLARAIYKRYIALLDGVPARQRGTIALPLRPDPLDRPRQVVDCRHGKTALTDYEVLSVSDGHARVALTPHTGRTHQLRMHCAHQEGLGCPIVGDRLYGKPAQRLCLHAAELAFRHPLTGERLHFTSPVPF